MSTTLEGDTVLLIKPEADRQFRKIKEQKHLLAISKKIEQIIRNPYHFKPLRFPLQGFRRVHVGDYVMIYRVEGLDVEICWYAHHDEVYRWRP